MARAATTTDVFNAIAESGRREILAVLGGGESAVGQIVGRVGMSQPQVSKHLAVLRAVGVVTSRIDGKRRLYRINGPALKPIHEWVSAFEGFWNDRLDRLDDYLTTITQEINR